MTNDYNHHGDDPRLCDRARAAARRFVAEEEPFHLGFLPTERPHPYTRSFSRQIAADTAAGLSRLFEVDMDLPPVARRVFADPNYRDLVALVVRIAREGGRIGFSGCGSSGRLAILLERMWRQFWEERAGLAPGAASRCPGGRDADLANRACSIMTGGDRALIRSVENFEDYHRFGARQVADLDLGKGDLLIAITEGGETSSVLGTAEAALGRGCRVALVFNNPASLLCERIERSRRVITDRRVAVFDLCTGSMALCGSTRLQATTMELLVLGSVLEAAVAELTGKAAFPAGTEVAEEFARLLVDLRSPARLAVLAAWAEMERDLYQRDGRVTYWADDFCIDIFADTTERSPTFMLPPLRPSDDRRAAASWAYVRDPFRAGREAWFAMLRRSPRGLEWSGEDYAAMGAPTDLVTHPPVLDNGEIYRYRIGRDDDAGRRDTALFWNLRIVQRPDHAFVLPEDAGSPGDLFTLEGTAPGITALGSDGERRLALGLSLPCSPMNLIARLALKVAVNAVSTGTMGLMGRIRENWMIQLDPTNKKLIDRGSRIIAQLSGLGYEEACYELHRAYFARAVHVAAGGRTTVSPVAAALERLGRL